jgi:hypothetical protein
MISESSPNHFTHKFVSRFSGCTPPRRNFGSDDAYREENSRNLEKVEE